jgi:CRISPR-associated helicase Cas3/CRISPR-associated endonuclease Cas3-HD
MPPDADHCFAHSANGCGRWHLLREHLDAVARLSGQFANGAAWSSEATLAGLLHDLGKYGALFQARLHGHASGLDHWSAGAWVALQNKCIAAALAIQGHHIGLQHLDKNALRELQPSWLAVRHPLGLRLTNSDVQALTARLTADRLRVPYVAGTVLGSRVAATVGTMLDVRILYSALVDADFLDTEAHFDGDASGKRYRREGASLCPDRALAEALAFVAGLRERSKASSAVSEARDSLLASCLEQAKRQPGLFTLTAPTGSGKTLAMLAFALAHAAEHRLERVILVVPYLTITEQTAGVYRSILAPIFGDEYVLEHHSLAGVGVERFTEDNESSTAGVGYAERRRRLLAENWDAPVVVTTSVQMLESLFSNRPAACRKLHRLRRAVIMFDEAQTLPRQLAVPTLAALSHLSSACVSSVVFATATQPAFTHLDPAVRATLAPGWTPLEIAPGPGRLFRPLHRVDVEWGSPDSHLTWGEVSERLAHEAQALCIVNLKRHARALWEQLEQNGALHLSTSMCAAHRQDVLKEVRERLAERRSVRLVSTQCVEAGVDLDFPFAMRAWGPLDSIIQAAGRCNREGRRAEPGKLHVFLPEDEGYPVGGYKQATDVAKVMFRRHGASGMRLDDPSFIASYYRELYDLSGVASSTESREILAAIESGSFPDVADLYRLIRKDAINVLVQYGPLATLFEELRSDADSKGLSGAWIRRARPITVSLYRPSETDPVWDSLIAVALGGRQHRSVSDWFIYATAEHYHPQLGLLPPGALNTWIA